MENKNKIMLSLALVAMFLLGAATLNASLYVSEPKKLNQVGVNVEIHCLVQQYRGGVLISETYHAMTLTNLGKNWIADKLSGASTTNNTKYTDYISLSNDETSVGATWTALPAEIAANGLTRAQGAIADTGTGTYTVIKTFTCATGAQSCCAYGLNFDSADNGLVAAEQQGSGARKNLLVGDTLAVTITVTCS